MNQAFRTKLSFDEHDERVNPRPQGCDFDRIVEAAISRRGFLGVMAMGSVAMLGSTSLTPARAQSGAAFPFTPIPAGTEDTVMVPEGYSWQVVAQWGDPLTTDGPAFDHETRGTGESQAVTYGDNTDGMELFEIDGHLVFCNNNEYTNLNVIFGNRADGKPETDDDVLKGKLAHGITIVELAQTDGKWGIVLDSPYNRRITPDTPMEITGPARGHELMKTAADPEGVQSLGTWNNCGAGRTPWGTYLTCEENFNGYYSSSAPHLQPNDDMQRYGISNEDWGYGWARIDERFDILKHPNESNRNGWVVEIDPSDASSTPKKRTALGRFKHENAEVVVNGDGRVVVYMGDDERGEFLYRYVSNGTYAEGGDTSTLLEDGTLYAAQFADDGTGQWLALTPETTGFADLGTVLIHARQAASKVGATTMDRPEWVAAHPSKAEVYCSLTNNSRRGTSANAGGDEMVVGGPNPRAKNGYGQIVRWRPDGEDHTVDGFAWDLYVLAGNPTVHDDAYGGSENVNADNMFNSPDGLQFAPSGALWIQTDGNYSNADDFAGQGNNQMLVGNPETGEIARFLVGPNECEITGLTWSPDRKTMFIGIQHPGEEGNSSFPGGEGTAPRSAIIAITRDDGAEIV